MGRIHARALGRSSETPTRRGLRPRSRRRQGRLPAGSDERVSDVDEVLADRSLDGVLIAAPTPLHDTLVERALVAGKHVLCEKPLTLDVRRDIALGRLAESLGRVLQVGFWRRFAWPYREASRLLAAGAIGVPRLMRASQWDSSPPAPEFCDPAVSGGIEIDCGVHEIDLAAWLLGSPIARVSASGTPGDPAIEAVGRRRGARRARGHSEWHAGDDRPRAQRPLRRRRAYRDRGSGGALLVSGVGTGSLAVGSRAGLEPTPPPTDDVLEDALARRPTCSRGRSVDIATLRFPEAGESAHALAAAQAMRRARLNRDVEDVTPAG